MRGPRTGWRFLAWLAVGLRWRFGLARGVPADPPAGAWGPDDSALGVEIAALGERSRAVFAASSRVARRLDGRHVDVVLADNPAEAAGIDVPAVILDDTPALAAPAFDPAADNPMGWVYEVEHRAAALGPRHRLPPGVRANRIVTPADRSVLAHCHHLEDVGAFHAGAAERAGTLARIAARGVPVHLADRDPALEALLGAEMHGLMSARIGFSGAAAREAISIRMRPAALRTRFAPAPGSFARRRSPIRPSCRWSRCCWRPGGPVSWPGRSRTSRGSAIRASSWCSPCTVRGSGRMRWRAPPPALRIR